MRTALSKALCAVFFLLAVAAISWGQTAEFGDYVDGLDSATPAGTDNVPIVQSNVPKRTTVTNLLSTPANPVFPSYSTTAYTGSQNINIDGASYTDYTYGPGAGTAGVYTTVITSGPSSGVRYITLTLVGGTNGITTITWTSVTAIGTALATSVTAGKSSMYTCIVGASTARCKIVAENY